MSRDFTPKQLYECEQRTLKAGRPDLLEFMKTLTWTYNGVSEPMYSPEYIAHCEEIPLLGRLVQKFDSLYIPLSKEVGGLEHLKKLNKELEEYIKTGIGDKNSLLIRWFEGELDQNFYYSERNEELFVGGVLENFKSLETARKPSLDLKINEAQTRINSKSSNIKTPEEPQL